MNILTEFRKIRFHIITIFSTVIIVFSVAIIYLMHFLNYRGMVRLSSVMIEQVADGVAGTISGITTKEEQFVKISRWMISKSDDVTPDNQSLLSVLLNAFKANPFLSQVAIGTTDGNFLVAYNVNISNLTKFHFSPDKPLPNGAQYALQMIDHLKTERWEYKDDELNTIASESSPIISRDLRLEPWFQKVAAWPNFSWHTSTIGFSASAPIWDSEQNFIGVFSASIPYQQLYNLITHEQVGFSGEVFLLDDKGKILVPPKSSNFIANAYDYYQKIKSPGFVLKNQKDLYVCHVAPFSLDIQTKWLLTIVVPFNDFFAAFEKAEQLTTLLSILGLLVCTIVIWIASKSISKPIVELSEQVNAIRNFDFTEPKPVKVRIWEIAILNHSIQLMRTALRSFERYVPKQIVRALLQHGNEIELGGEQRELTILFSDIENFTTKAEILTSDQLVAALTEYFNVLSKIISDTQGTIDKYIGDSIMAFWNAPKVVHDHAQLACTAALRFTKLPKATENIFLQGKTRFGIHTGEVVVGNFGSVERLTYTALGDTVNTSSRLQSLNKEYNTSILISESVQQELGLRFLTRPLDAVSVKGRHKRITIFELVGALHGDADLLATPAEIELCEKFTQAYELFHEGKMGEAKTLFAQILEQFPHDSPTKHYLSRLT